MANEREPNRRERAYEAAPDKRVERNALEERGMDLTEEKARLETERPIDTERIKEIDRQLHVAQEKYVDLLKDEFGRRRSESRIRAQFQRRINRYAKRSIDDDTRNDVDLDVNVTVSGAPGAPAISARAETGGASPRRRPEQREALPADLYRDALDDSRDRREDMKMDIEEYISSNSALVVVAQKFRESTPPLLASSLRGGPDTEYAIRVALFAYPDLADRYIEDIKAGGARADSAREVIGDLADNLEDYMSHAVEREQLQVEMARDSFTKEAGSRLGKVMDEFRRHPVPALIGTAALIGAVTLIYKNVGEKAKKWMKGIAGGSALAVSGGMLANMIYRSQTDDGSDLWDALGFKPEDASSGPSRLQQMNDLYPELDIANDQQARDMMIMLDADADLVYDLFYESFTSAGDSIAVNKLSRDKDIKAEQTNSMNGKAAYTALEGYFTLLAEKTAKKEGRNLSRMSERQIVEEGMNIFHREYVGRPDSIDLGSAILMTIDRVDSRRAASSIGVDTGETLNMSEGERASRSAVDRALERHGMGDTVVGRVETVDGVEYVMVNGYPWEYTHDSERGLHTFTDTFSKKTFNVGETVGDRVDKNSRALAQSLVNKAFPLIGKDKIEWDEDLEAYVSTEKVKFRGISFLGLGEREREIQITFRPNETVPYLKFTGSKLEPSNDYIKVKQEHERERVAEKLKSDLGPFLGSLALETEGFTDPTKPNGDVTFEWGPTAEYRGLVSYKSGKIDTLSMFTDTSGSAPEALVQQWENLGDTVADQLVSDNPDVNTALEGLASVFAGKSGTPESVRDFYTFLENSTIYGEDEKYAEAIKFQKGTLRAEVKRAVVQEFRDDPISMLDPATRSARIETIKKDIVETRVKEIRVLASSIASSSNAGGDLAKTKIDSAEKVRDLGACKEYQDWMDRIRNKMGEGVLDTAGMEGGEKARHIQDAILLTIMEYSSPMHKTKALFDDPEAKKWRDNLDRNIAVIFSRAIQMQEGNWWIDQRYNAAGFKKALLETAPPIRPWRSMEADLKALVGSTSAHLSIPFLDDVEYESNAASRRSKYNIDSYPEYTTGASLAVYRSELSRHVMSSARSIFSEFDDLEFSITDDKYDDFINWRVARASQYFNEQSLDSTGKPRTDAEMKKVAEEIINDLVLDSTDFIPYLAQLYPEGALGMFNAWNEADPSVLRNAELSMVESMILDGTFKNEWKGESREVLEWLNSTYKDENILGLGVPWVRTDLMRIWMDKIDYGLPSGPNSMIPGTNNDNTYKYTATDMDDYRVFFTNVAEDLMPRESFSVTDPQSIFRRIDQMGWKSARGNLEDLPTFDEWMVTKSKREEVGALDWKQNESIREYKEMREMTKEFMKAFDGRFNVAQFTRFDGRWPDLFKSHARERLEGEVMANADNPHELEAELLKFEQYLDKEAAFYNTIIDGKVEYGQGEDVQNISVAALASLGFLGGTVGGAVLGGSLGMAAGPGGAILGGTAGGIVGGGAGTLTGAIVGKGIDFLPIPQIGFQIGEPLHSRLRTEIDAAFDASYNNPAKSPDDYFNDLQVVLQTKIKEAIAMDAESLDMGPFTMSVPGGNIDRVNVTP